MRLADAELLPFEFGNLADTVQMYVKDLKSLWQKMRDEMTERNREIEEGVFEATNDPKKPFVSPKIETVPPHLNFASLDNAVDALTRSAQEYSRALASVSANGGVSFGSANLHDVNSLLLKNEQKLLTSQGLPDRPWYKHELYAPGFYTGYAVKTMPRVREAIELKQWKRAQDAIQVLSGVLEGEANYIAVVSAKLDGTTQGKNVQESERRVALVFSRDAQ
jgi:N-acetylated-alpha-linked acidic dipeptidase